MRRWSSLAGATFGAWVLVAVLLASGAAAHAVLVDAQPADGASLPEPPAELRLRFNEPVAVVALQLVDDSGTAITDLEIEAAAERIVIRPATPLRHGAFLLSYRVVSTNGHPVRASLRFGVGTAAEPAARAGVPDGDVVRLSAVAARLAFLATALGAGGAALSVVVTRPPPPLSGHCVRVARSRRCCWSRPSPSPGTPRRRRRAGSPGRASVCTCWPPPYGPARCCRCSWHCAWSATARSPSSSASAAPLPTSAVATLAGDGLRAELVLTPGRAGANRVEVRLEDAGGARRDAAAVRLHLALPQAGIEPAIYELGRVAPGRYLAPVSLVPVAGTWALRLDLLVDDFTKIILEGQIEIR